MITDSGPASTLAAYHRERVSMTELLPLHYLEAEDG